MKHLVYIFLLIASGIGAQPVMHEYFFAFKLFSEGSIVHDSSSGFQILPKKYLLQQQDKDSLHIQKKYDDYFAFFYCYPCGVKRKKYLADSAFLSFTVIIVRSKKDTMQITFEDVVIIDSIPFLSGKFMLRWGDINKLNEKKKGFAFINWEDYRLKEIERKED